MKHLIKIETTEHGALSVRHMGKDQQWCEAGQSVKVNNQPDAGWGLQKLYYVVAGSSEKHPINIATRTFIMPNGNVTIGGVFKRFVVGDWTEGKNPNVGHLLAVGENGEPVPTSATASDISSKFVPISHSELLTRRNNGTLVPGTWYRITDYVTTTKMEGTQSAYHEFDIIVRADSNSTLNENAFAALPTKPEPDNYFADSHIEAWQLKYCIDNDVERFPWCDPDTGYGVIYWMRDQNGNEAPYDFKNIMFLRDMTWMFDHEEWASHNGIENPRVDIYFFTFSGWNSIVQRSTDLSLKGKFCENNIIEGYGFVGKNVFLHGEEIYPSINNNKLGYGCEDNTFGSHCVNNKFGVYCRDNVAGCSFESNTFGNYVEGNEILDDVQYNEVKDYVSFVKLMRYTQYVVFYHVEGMPNNLLQVRYATQVHFAQVVSLDSHGNVTFFALGDIQ